MAHDESGLTLQQYDIMDVHGFDLFLTSEHLVKTVGEILIAVTNEETERRHTVGLGPGLLSKIHVPSLTVEFSARRVGFGVFCRRSVLNTGYVQCQVISSHHK